MNSHPPLTLALASDREPAHHPSPMDEPAVGSSPGGRRAAGLTPRGSVDLSRRGLHHLVGRGFGDRRVRYVLVGGAAAIVYYGSFSAGWLALAGRIPYLLITVLANACTAIVTYPLYRREVFQHTGPWLPGFLRFYATCLWALAFSLVGLPLLVELGHLHVLIAQAVIIIASPLINYQIHRFWAFRESS